MRLVPWIAAGAVAVAVVAIVTQGLSMGVPSTKTAVATATLSEKRVSAAGAVASQHDSGAYAPLQTTVKRILVSDQEHVVAGEPLVILDDEPYQVAKAQALSAIRQAEAAKSSLAKQTPSDAGLSAARTAVTAAREQRWLAHTNLQDALDRKADASTLRGLRVGVTSAQAECEKAAAALRTLDTASDTTKERRAADAALKAGKRAYAKAVRDLRNVVVCAPFTGTVFLAPTQSAQGPTSKLVPGQGVSPQVPLLRIADTGALKFVADVDQDDLAAVHSGQPTLVTLDAAPNRRLAGSTAFVALVSKTTRSGVTAFTVEASLPQGSHDLRVGMEGTAEIVVAKSISAVRVPQQAVTRRDGAAVVFVVASGTARLRHVTLGPATGTDYEITSGLASGAIVATSGLEQLHDGARVSAK
jgi:HlyD family secretion protein